MEVSIEGFLLDNLLMNLLMLRLCSALSGLPVRRLAGFGAALLGAIYALLSVAVLPALTLPIPKLLLGCALVLPMVYHRRDYGRALLFLYLSACLMGGVMLCVCILFGGSLTNGVLIGTVPLRIALLGAALCALLPRLFRELRRMFDSRQKQVRLRISFSDRTVELMALVDSGNLLTEPVSGKPVVIVQQGVLKQPLENCRPVAFQTLGGAGFLSAVQPRRISVFYRRWHALDALVAESPVPIAEADAIIAGSLMPAERGKKDAETIAATDDALVPAADQQAQEGTLLHTFGGDAAAALRGAGGTGVDRTIDGGGTGSKECAD